MLHSHWEDWCWSSKPLATWCKELTLEKTLMLGKIEGRRRRGRQRMRWLHRITYSMNMRLSKPREMVKDREAWRAAVHRVTKNWTWLSDWTTTKQCKCSKCGTGWKPRTTKLWTGLLSKSYHSKINTLNSSLAWSCYNHNPCFPEVIILCQQIEESLLSLEKQFPGCENDWINYFRNYCPFPHTSGFSAHALSPLRLTIHLSYLFPHHISTHMGEHCFYIPQSFTC